MSDFRITPAGPGESGVRHLIERQLALGRAASPREDAHALEVDELADPTIALFAARDGDEVLAIGALKRLDPEHGELKAMHTAEVVRGRGLGRAMLGRLLEEARAQGMRRVSLETGAMAEFAPARSLYMGAGFEPCAPFADYVESPNSVYLSRSVESLRPDISVHTTGKSHR